ncbi:MAG: 4Fe-4S cluster-binding domain-containing protein [Candidatus Improbicoccus devescovinae]|nr:MAG: 4Fe-4S cluster-binding domain-containing protein [Candidatus Improbicoccus devescovinae]
MNNIKNTLEDCEICVKTIVDETFQDYKLASMLIGMPMCDFKCFNELGLSPKQCQNYEYSQLPNKKFKIKNIFLRYITNKITRSIVFGGMEPFLSFNEIYDFINYCRINKCNDDIVIYTGYYEHEIEENVEILRQFNNIIIKFGRFIPNSEPKFDKILGIILASKNQFAVRIS